MTHPLFRMGGLHASSNNQHTKAGQINEQIAYNMRGWDIDSSVKVALINIHISPVKYVAFGYYSVLVFPCV